MTLFQISVRDQYAHSYREVERGSLGGKFTTIEGLINDILDGITFKNPFFVGDSETELRKEKYRLFLEKLKTYSEGKESFTIIIDDPLANSYIQDVCFPDIDTQLTVETYTRSFEVDDEFGLNDMKTEDY